MTRRPWRLYAARATFPFPQLLVLPSLEKSNRYAARKHQRLFTAFHPQILLKTLKKEQLSATLNQTDSYPVAPKFFSKMLAKMHLANIEWPYLADFHPRSSGFMV